MQLKRVVFVFTGFAGLMTFYSIIYTSQPENLQKLKTRLDPVITKNGKRIDSGGFTLPPHPKVIDEYFTTRKVCFLNHSNVNIVFICTITLTTQLNLAKPIILFYRLIFRR